MIADGKAAKSYHSTISTIEHVVKCLTQLSASNHLRNGEVSSFLFTQFAEDAQADGLTFAEIDYGFAQWRRKKTSFMPTYGEFLDVIRKGEGERGGPGKATISIYHGRIKRLVDPAYRSPAVKYGRGKANEPESLSLQDQYTQARDLFEKWKAQRGKGGYYTKFDQWVNWSETSENLFNGLAANVERLEAKLGAKS